MNMENYVRASLETHVFHLHNHQWRLEAEDTGEKGYNYRSERFTNRLKQDGRIWKVFSSKIHGDPATPVWKAYSGDRVIFRTMMPADKPRNVSLAIHGHLWREQPDDALSREIPIQGGISIGNRFDMELKDGASCPGDYLYRSGSFGWDVESGMWGIFRVMKQSLRCKCKEVGGKLPFHFGGNKTSLMIQSIKKQKKKEKHRGR